MMDAIKIWVSEMQQFDVSSQQSIETFVPEEVERLCHSFGTGKPRTKIFTLLTTFIYTSSTGEQSRRERPSSPDQRSPITDTIHSDQQFGGERGVLRRAEDDDPDYF